MQPAAELLLADGEGVRIRTRIDLVAQGVPEALEGLERGTVLELFRAVIANNRAGGWRRVRSTD